MTPDEIRQLRELADGATKGPWFIENGNGGPEDIFINGKNGKRIARMWKIGNHIWEDTSFIAAANPTNIISLLDTIDRLKMQNDCMREALKFYSVKEDFEFWWGPDEINAHCKLDTAHDGGKRARQALKDCGGMK